MDDQPDVVEAIKRLPSEERDLRLFRLKRAYDLTMKQIILPEEQWTKPEEVTVDVVLKLTSKGTLFWRYYFLFLQST